MDRFSVFNVTGDMKGTPQNLHDQIADFSGRDDMLLILVNRNLNYILVTPVTPTRKLLHINAFNFNIFRMAWVVENESFNTRIGKVELNFKLLLKIELKLKWELGYFWMVYYFLFNQFSTSMWEYESIYLHF